MSEWRGVVRQGLAAYRARTGRDVIRLSEVYDAVLPASREAFPDNHNQRAKIRQILQQLRDRGEVDFLDDGKYTLDGLDEAKLSGESKAAVEEASQRSETADRVRQQSGGGASSEPARTQRIVDELVRDPSLVADLKALYDCTCQLCGARRKQGPDTRYAECHHVKPLGDPHRGPDTRPNLLVLCPDHHVDFDYGMVRVDPRSLAVDHAYDSSVHAELETRHEVGERFLTYHNDTIACEQFG
ncbi:HNH endonuclease [Salinirubellus salinus]|uniref:HNH endonuclease n=1 Tax=Salinirubellus salinus TaxID=1364945 RepID=A0A9E7R181_9EURY|nr:HNH endonuclease [Salinirubellus salinus]UWM53409.1 HNH endonuclease [Salinirubellus salinus]